VKGLKIARWVGAVGIVSLVALPIVGMIFAHAQPPGLVTPPPLEWGRVWPLVLRTLLLAFGVAAASLLLGTVLGFAQARMAYRGRRVLGVLSILPLAIPSYLIAAIVRESMAPNGPLGSLLATESVFTGMGPAALVLTVACTPYVQVLVASALTRFPAAEEEAARALGAPPLRRFRSLLLPRLRPTFSFALLLVSLYVISDFGAVAVLDCPVLTWELYQARGARDAIVLGFAIMACVIPLLALLRLLAGSARPERSLGAPRMHSRTPLRGTGRFAVLLAHAIQIGVGVLLPVTVLCGWVFRGWMNDVSFAPLEGPVLNTALYTILGASCTLACAAIPAWLVARDASRRAGNVLEQATYLTSAVPGILLAFGVLHLLLGLQRHAPWTLATGEGGWATLEGMGVFLILAYVMRFLGEGYAALKPAILGLDLRQEESARSLGASRWRTFRRVTWPALIPGVTAAFLLLFLSIAKELPVTLMLTPLGEQTLAYRVFDAQQEASLMDVGLAGLLLLCLAVGMQLILMRWRRHA